MAPSLGKYLNKTILVSIPPLSGDVKCRPYKLMGIELTGLWLEGPDLARDFLEHEHKSHSQATWSFFIPYSQIACVAIGAMPVVLPGARAVQIAGRDPGRAPGPVAPKSVAEKPSPVSSPASHKEPKHKEHKEHKER